MASQTPLKTGQTRIFLIEGRASPANEPSYESQLRPTGISQGFGDEERVEAPDPRNYGKFVEVATIKGATERVSTSLEGRYARDLLSKLLRLAQKGCAYDLQIHAGACSDPQNFNEFEKALILEKASNTTWNTDDLGALSSDENAIVNENADVSASDVYEVLPLTLQKQGASSITNEIIDVVYCDSISCGDCDDESDGCSKAYAISKAAGGSPGTPADVIYTDDDFANVYAHDIDTLDAAEDPDAIDCVGDYIVIVSNASGSIHYEEQDDFAGGLDPVFTEVSTGVVAGGEPNDIFSVGRKAFVVGDAGYVYTTTDPTAGLTVVDAGEATVDDLHRVHAISEEFAVAVGENGVVIFTENGSTWGEVTTRPVGVGVTLNTIAVKDEKEWWVGTDGGELFYSLDQGETWTEKTFTGSGTGEVHDIVFATDSIAYLSHATASPAGRLLRSYDGGYSWKVLPESTGVIPANDRINRLAVCGSAALQDAANHIVGGGLADDASDGYLVYGQAV